MPRAIRYHVTYWVRMTHGEYTPAWIEIVRPAPIFGPNAVRAIEAEIESRFTSKGSRPEAVVVAGWQRYEYVED